MRYRLRTNRSAEPHTTPAAVRVTGISHRFGSFRALRDVSLDVHSGEFLTLLGPSGSGKTTLLRLVGGLLQVQNGHIHVGERDITDLPPRKRDAGFVFQNYAVFPHLTVFDNVAFPLRLRQVEKAMVQTRVTAALEKVSLTDFATRLPAQLSGGQQQRVALARAIVYEPRVLLMDEPLGALDKRLRRGLQVEIRQLQQDLGITTLYVTHDQEEAFAMSDRIAVMHDGQIVQVDTPDQIYYEPASPFVADFVGDMNRLDGVLEARNGRSATLRTAEDLRVVVAAVDAQPGVRAECGIRPEKLKVGRGVQADNVLASTVRAVRFNGSHLLVHLLLADTSHEFIAEVHQSMGSELHVGQEIMVGWDIEAGRVFPAEDPTAGEMAQTSV